MKGNSTFARRNVSLSFSDGIIAAVFERHELGVHSSSPFALTLDEIAEQFAFNDRRRELYNGLARFVAKSRSLPSPPVLQLLFGSFVEAKDEPSDVDILNVVTQIDQQSFSVFYDRERWRGAFGVDPSTIVLERLDYRTLLSFAREITYLSSRRDMRQKGIIAIAP